MRNRHAHARPPHSTPHATHNTPHHTSHIPHTTPHTPHPTPHTTHPTHKAEARCHRIGQTRPVKIYRFITVKTYERRMFERASQKQGLEQAVIRGQQTNGPKKSAKEQKLELERLLRHGAYDLFQDGEAESNSFNEQDIDSILAARSTKIEQEAKGAGSNLMSTASFVPASAGVEVL